MPSIDNSLELLTAYHSGFLLYSPLTTSLTFLGDAIKYAFKITLTIIYLTILDICSGRNFWSIWTVIFIFQTSELTQLIDYMVIIGQKYLCRTASSETKWYQVIRYMGKLALRFSSFKHIEPRYLSLILSSLLEKFWALSSVFIVSIKQMTFLFSWIIWRFTWMALDGTILGIKSQLVVMYNIFMHCFLDLIY